ncbi:MAG: ATP-binding protein [Burkholderiaceae bacterium]
MSEDRVPSHLVLPDTGDYANCADALHEQIIGSFCHDLRQPLNAALMRLASLKRAYTSGQDRELLEELHLSLREIARMSETVFDAIRLSRASIRPNLGAVSIADLFERVRTEYAPLAEQKNLRLVIAPSPFLVVTDEILLSRILLNLVQNALHYTRTGGVLVAARRHAGQLSLEVWDTGPGIPPDELEKVFTPFYRGSHERERRTKNSGIGLWNGREFARLLGGTLTVSSRHGRGSVFRLRLPLELEVFRRAKPGAAVRTPLSSRKLVALLAPDQEALVEEQRLVLARCDGHVSFTDPLQLLAYLNVPLNRPDALLIDLRIGPVAVDFLVGILAARFSELPLAVVADDFTDPLALTVARLGVRLVPKPLTAGSLDGFLKELTRPVPRNAKHEGITNPVSKNRDSETQTDKAQAPRPKGRAKTKSANPLHPVT